MCCQQGGVRKIFSPGWQTFDCGCGCGSFTRRFVSSKEEREGIQEYKAQLEKEIAAVEEHLAKLKNK